MQEQEKRITTLPINITAEGCAFAIKHSYNKNFAISTATNGSISLVPQSKKSSVKILGTYSENSLIGGRVIDINGIAPSIMAGTHGYGFGVILECSTLKPDA